MYICIYDILAIFDQSWKKKERRKKIEKYFKSSCLRELKSVLWIEDYLKTLISNGLKPDQQSSMGLKTAAGGHQISALTQFFNADYHLVGFNFFKGHSWNSV